MSQFKPDEQAALNSLFMLLANHRDSLSCNQMDSRSPSPEETINLPDSYGPCVFPAVPTPDEILANTWGQNKPQGKLRHIKDLFLHI